MIIELQASYSFFFDLVLYKKNLSPVLQSFKNLINFSRSKRKVHQRKTKNDEE